MRIQKIPRSLFSLIVAGSICLSLPTTSAAKKKKLDNESLKMAKFLVKDRQKAFWNEEGAIPLDEFQAKWKELAVRLDTMYSGHQVRLRKFGSDHRFREWFAHLNYMGLRVHVKVTPLNPGPQNLIARHPFLQELLLKGSFYTRDSKYPKKISDLLAVNPQMLKVARETLDFWDSENRKAFEKQFPEGGLADRQ